MSQHLMNLLDCFLPLICFSSNRRSFYMKTNAALALLILANLSIASAVTGLPDTTELQPVPADSKLTDTYETNYATSSQAMHA